MQMSANNTGIYYALIRAAFTGVGVKACAAKLQSLGVPAAAGITACSWAIDKLWTAWFETLPAMGAPTWKDLQTGVQGVHWRPCANPSGLSPGEHWEPAVGGLPARCKLNVAILQQGGLPLRIVYVPCERMGGLNPGAVCRDRDGGFRTKREGLREYWPGLYGERLDQWPLEFEQTPWQPPIVHAKAMTQVSMVDPASVVTALPYVWQYPAGSFAVYDPITEHYRILLSARK